MCMWQWVNKRGCRQIFNPLASDIRLLLELNAKLLNIFFSFSKKDQIRNLFRVCLKLENSLRSGTGNFVFSSITIRCNWIPCTNAFSNKLVTMTSIYLWWRETFEGRQSRRISLTPSLTYLSSLMWAESPSSNSAQMPSSTATIFANKHHPGTAQVTVGPMLRLGSRRLTPRISLECLTVARKVP